MHLIPGLVVTVGQNLAPLPTAGKSIFNLRISEWVRQPADCYILPRNSFCIKRKACAILTDSLVTVS
jgi:hypothetical protein